MKGRFFNEKYIPKSVEGELNRLDYINGWYTGWDNAQKEDITVNSWNRSKIMEDKERKELLDCIHNLMGFFDTPIARLKMSGKDYEEVRKIGREVLKKYNINYRGL